MAEPTAPQPARPLQLLESEAAGYCDPVTGLCVLPAALPELRGDPETTALPGHAEKVTKEEHSMPLITIVGAGPGLGLEIARAFGRQGFRVALVARNAAKLRDLAATLKEEGIDAAGFPADLLKPESITSAFAQIKAAYGAVDVLEISAVDQALAAANVLEVTPENLQPQLDFYLSAIHAVRQVTDDMIAAKSGTILITTGGGSVNPVPFLANINIAAAGLRNWTLNLHNVMKEHGVHVTHVAISAWIGGGHPDADADVIAKVYPELHASRDQAELHYVALDA